MLQPYWGILALGRFLYGPHCARSVLPRPRANIPQYGPRARLVIYIALYDLPLDAKLWHWVANRAIISCFRCGFHFLGNRHFSQKLFGRAESYLTILSKLLYLYNQKSRDVSKITFTDQKMFVFHHGSWLFEFLDRQQSLGTQFL